MKFFLASVIALGLAASTALAQLTVNTPLQVVACQPLQITWSGGTGPYFLSIVPGSSPSGAALISLGEFAADTYAATWLVNLPTGTQIVFVIRDSTGVTALSAIVTITSSSVTCNTSSLSVSPSTGVGAATGSSGSTPTGSSPATATTPGPINPINPNTGVGTGTSTGASTSGHTVKSGASSTSTSSTSAQSAGASRVTGQIAAAGIIGAAMVALLG